MRRPSQHLDDNTLVDLLARAVPAEEADALAVHLFTCAPCREILDICRRLGDVVASATAAAMPAVRPAD